MSSIERIGILTGGGDAPGLNAVIRAVVKSASNWGVEVVGLEEVVSMTATTNRRSQAVMRRLGMTRDPADDFDHPRVLETSPLRRHVLYRLPSHRWLETLR